MRCVAARMDPWGRHIFQGDQATAATGADDVAGGGASAFRIMPFRQLGRRDDSGSVTRMILALLRKTGRMISRTCVWEAAVRLDLATPGARVHGALRRMTEGRARPRRSTLRRARTQSRTLPMVAPR